MTSQTTSKKTVVEDSVPVSGEEMTSQTNLSSIREPNPMKTESGEEHGLIKVVANSVPNSEGKRFKEPHRSAMQKMRDEESRMVKVQYINTKGSNERLERPYMRWDGDPVLTYRFIPEYTYTVPKGLVDEVNNKKIPKRSDLVDPRTKQPMMMDKFESSEHRFVPSRILTKDRT